MLRIGWLLIFALLAHAEEEQEVKEPVVRRISFDDAIELGLAYNLGLKSARFEALVARLQVAREDAAWDWILDSGLEVGESLTPSRSQLAGADIVDTDSANFVLGLTKPFRGGPTLGLNWRNDRTFNNSSFATINPAYDTNLDLTLTVPLLRGRGRDVQEATLRASRAAADAARYRFLDTSERLIQQIADAYWNLVFLQERVKVFERALEIAKDIERVEERKLAPDIGRATVLTVAQAKATRHGREADLIEAELQAANGADSLRRLILPFTGGMDDAVKVWAKSELRDRIAVADMADLVEEAMGRRHDLRENDALIEQLMEGVVAARNNLRIRLDFEATVGTTGVNSTFEQSVTDAFTGDAYNYRGGLTLNWPIGRRDAKAALRQAQLNLDRARVDRQEKVNEVVAEVRIAHRTIRENIREIVARRQEFQASLQALEGERVRQKRGVTTVLDVARLEENTVNAALRLLQAQTELERAYVEMLRASGSLLNKWNVQFSRDLERK
ncbi:MAG: TolC family protein [Planctomycetota bacterium]